MNGYVASTAKTPVDEPSTDDGDNDYEYSSDCDCDCDCDYEV